MLPTRGEERVEFYRMYRDKAEEHDREFIGKYDEDLNNTLIFVGSFVAHAWTYLLSLQAGLFSAVTSAFITQVQPELQPNSGDDTAALLRVLLYKIDNTTFGSDIPTLPQWTGPPNTIVQVQALLYASLAISLFSAFLAMLGKQWLNRYASIDTQESTIERSQSRQQKLNGIVTWCFNYVIESLPLMLQGALFLLGCALSLYLWGINTTVAWVVLGLTSLGVIFYLFIIVAGTVSVNCPYQTPHARVLQHIVRHTIPLVLSTLKQAAPVIVERSGCITVLTTYRSYLHKCMRAGCWCFLFCFCFFCWSEQDIYTLPLHFVAFLACLPALPIAMVYDVCLLILAISRAFSAHAHKASVWFHGTRKWASKTKTDTADIQCISWILRASMDKVVHLLALKLLATMTTLEDFSPNLTSACFDILIGCVVVVDDEAVVTQESEDLAVVSAHCCLHALSRLAATDPTLSTIKRARKQYTRAFPSTTNFDAVSPNHSLRAIHSIFYSVQPKIQWKDYKLLDEDQVTLARTLVEHAIKHVSGTTQNTLDVFLRGRQDVKVPRWILRFALHYLSQDPPPPTSIVINCLLIIAIDLGCSFPLNDTTRDERYFYVLSRFAILTRN